MGRIAGLTQPRWWNGRHASLRSSWGYPRGGSSPLLGTKLKKGIRRSPFQTTLYLSIQRLEVVVQTQSEGIAVQIVRFYVDGWPYARRIGGWFFVQLKGL